MARARTTVALLIASLSLAIVAGARAEGEVPPATTTIGTLNVLPQYKISYGEGEFVIVANCMGGTTAVCSGGVRIQNYPNARAAKKHGSKLRVLADQFYTMDYSNNGGLFVPAQSGVTKTMRKLDSLWVFINPTGGSNRAYRIAILR